jgi:hypothetical protein
MRSERARGCFDQVAGRVMASGVSTWPEAPRPSARPLGKKRRRGWGNTLDAAPHSGLARPAPYWAHFTALCCAAWLGTKSGISRFPIGRCGDTLYSAPSRRACWISELREGSMRDHATPFGFRDFLGCVTRGRVTFPPFSCDSDVITRPWQLARSGSGRCFRRCRPAGAPASISSFSDG